MLCSDIGTTATLARSLHKNYDVAHLIEYAEIDATAIPFCKETFDFVVFKSVLGVIGKKPLRRNGPSHAGNTSRPQTWRHPFLCGKPAGKPLASFGTPLVYPLGKKLVLPQSCRNGQLIAQLCSKRNPLDRLFLRICTQTRMAQKLRRAN